jgi:hypothetical protein
MQREVKQIQTSKSKAADALRMSERAISDSNRKIAELAKQRRTANQKLAGLEAQQARLSGDIQVQQSLLIKQHYRQDTNGNLVSIDNFFDRKMEEIKMK